MKTQKFDKEYHRDYYHRVRKQKIFDYLGGACVVCGSTEKLEIDHINPEEKSFHISKRLSLKNNKEEFDKCQLLCQECHTKKTVAQKQPFRHGTMYGWMKKHCSCDECQGEKRRWNDERNAKRRKSK